MLDLLFLGQLFLSIYLNFSIYIFDYSQIHLQIKDIVIVVWYNFYVIIFLLFHIVFLNFLRLYNFNSFLYHSFFIFYQDRNLIFLYFLVTVI